MKVPNCVRTSTMATRTSTGDSSMQTSTENGDGVKKKYLNEVKNRGIIGVLLGVVECDNIN